MLSSPWGLTLSLCRGWAQAHMLREHMARESIQVFPLAALRWLVCVNVYAARAVSGPCSSSTTLIQDVACDGAHAVCDQCRWI